MSELIDDLFEVANFFPATTGLPMTVWVSPRGRLIAEIPDPGSQQAVSAWTSLNEDALVRYWNGEIDAIQLAQQLRRLP